MIMLALQNYGPQHVCLLPFLTHFADLSSWEYAKKLKTIIPQIEAAGTQASCLTCPLVVAFAKTNVCFHKLYSY